MSLEEEIESYVGCTDYFLIDWGMGTGKPMDLQSVLGYVRQVRNTVPYHMIAVAGGIGPHTYPSLREVFALSNEISTDMQGQMRTSGKATDPIEMDRVCASIRGICYLL